jgi:hypothetical protein
LPQRRQTGFGSTYTNLLRAICCPVPEAEDICFGASSDTVVVGAMNVVLETYFCGCCKVGPDMERNREVRQLLGS